MRPVRRLAGGAPGRTVRGMPPFVCPGCDGTRRVVRGVRIVSATWPIPGDTLVVPQPCRVCVPRDSGPRELTRLVLRCAR